MSDMKKDIKLALKDAKTEIDAALEALEDDNLKQLMGGIALADVCIADARKKTIQYAKDKLQ